MDPTQPGAAPNAAGGSDNTAAAQAVVDALCDALQASLAEPGMADAWASAESVASTFDASGAIAIDVDGAKASIPSSVTNDDPDADDASMTPPPAA